jgi:hypothetical protein
MVDTLLYPRERIAERVVFTPRCAEPSLSARPYLTP